MESWKGFYGHKGVRESLFDGVTFELRPEGEAGHRTAWEKEVQESAEALTPEEQRKSRQDSIMGGGGRHSLDCIL